MSNLMRLLSCAFIILATSAQAVEYDIDPAHSNVTFKIKHLSISTVSGRFDKFSGTFDADPANLKALKATADIDVSSIDTAEPKRDAHLRTPDFFDTAKFPQMTFVTKEVKDNGGNKLSIVGDLTLHGVTKPVTLDAEFGGIAKDPSGTERAAITASTVINRKDFGISVNTGGVMLGEEVRVELSIEGIKKK